MRLNLPNQNQSDEKQKREEELDAQRNRFNTPEINEFISQSSFKEAANVEAEIKNIQNQPNIQTEENTNTSTDNQETETTPIKNNKKGKKHIKRKDPKKLRVHKVVAYLEEDTYKQFAQICDTRYLSMTAIFRQLIMNYIKKSQ